MNKERLQRLAELLDTVNPKLFGIEHWANHVGDDGTDFHDSTDPECRTAACAVGWAASDPWFRDQGLALKKRPSLLGPEDCFWTPVFNGESGRLAVRRFFDLTYHGDVDYLFVGEDYKEDKVTPAMVAARIREFMGLKSET